MVMVLGLLKAREIITKKGDRMAFLALEDAVSTAEMVVFPKAFIKVEQWLDSYHVLVVKALLMQSQKTV